MQTKLKNLIDCNANIGGTDMNVYKFIALMMIGMSFQADAQSILIEACNALENKDRRLECLKEAMAIIAKTDNSNAASDALRQSFEDIQASISAGISYNNYQREILDLAKAVSRFKAGDKLSDANAVELFEQAVEAYSDAAIFWERSIEFYAKEGNELAYAGGLPVKATGMEWLVSKYGLPTAKSDILGIHRGLHVTGTRLLLFDIAKAKMHEGFSALK